MIEDGAHLTRMKIKDELVANELADVAKQKPRDTGTPLNNTNNQTKKNIRHQQRGKKVDRAKVVEKAMDRVTKRGMDKKHIDDGDEEVGDEDEEDHGSSSGLFSEFHLFGF